MATRSEVLELLYEAIDEINLQLPPEAQLQKTEDCPIVGDRAELDSLGLLNLILAAETLVNEHHGPPVSLAEKLMASEDASPPETLAALADVIIDLQEAEEG